MEELTKKIHQSAQSNNVLRIQYKDKGDQPSIRNVEPYEIRDGKLWAYCRKRKSIRKFDMKRIESASVTKYPYTPKWPVKTDSMYFQNKQANEVDGMDGLVKLAHREKDKKPFTPGATPMQGAGYGAGIGGAFGLATGLARDFSDWERLKANGPDHALKNQLVGFGLGAGAGAILQHQVNKRDEEFDKQADVNDELQKNLVNLQDYAKQRQQQVNGAVDDFDAKHNQLIQQSFPDQSFPTKSFPTESFPAKDENVVNLFGNQRNQLKSGVDPLDQGLLELENSINELEQSNEKSTNRINSLLGTKENPRLDLSNIEEILQNRRERMNSLFDRKHQQLEALEQNAVDVGRNIADDFKATEPRGLFNGGRMLRKGDLAIGGAAALGLGAAGAGLGAYLHNRKNQGEQ